MTVSLSTRLSNNKKLHTITIAHKKKKIVKLTLLNTYARVYVCTFFVCQLTYLRLNFLKNCRSSTIFV